MRLSIIIPAYNVEQYLERCVESCEKQDIPREDYEVIVVDDGSPDDTLQVANMLALRYDNMVVLTQENGGSSKARNHGLKEAKGDYVWFVDADDYIVDNCIGRVLALCEENDLDICHFSLDLMNEKGEMHRDKYKMPYETILDGRDILLCDAASVVCSACANFYKHIFLRDNDICFTEGITQQDVEINGRVFAIAQRCMFVDDSMYIYFYNSDSIRRSARIEKQVKYAGDTIRIAAMHRDYYVNRCNDKELREFFVKHTNSRIAGAIYSKVKNNDDKRILDEVIKVAKEKGLYPLKGKTLSQKWDLLLFVLNHRCLWWIFKFI